MRNMIWLLALVSLVGCQSDQDLKNPEHTVYPPSHVEPLPGQSREDRFIQPTGEPADILFVMDKSCSMIDDATQLNYNIPLFFDALDQYNIDYHVGVISTDVIGEPLGELVSWEGSLFATPQDDGPFVFSMMNGIAGMQGEGESGIDAIFAAMKLGKDYNQSFFRTLTPLHLIVVSDEEDSSTHREPVELYRFLQQWSGERNEKVYFSGVLTLPESTCGIYGGSSVGYRYMELVDHLQGELADICNDDWSSILSDLALLATPNLYQEFYLSEIPLTDDFCLMSEKENCIEFHVVHDGITFSYENSGMLEYDPVGNGVKIIEGYTPINGDLITINYPVE